MHHNRPGPVHTISANSPDSSPELHSNAKVAFQEANRTIDIEVVGEVRESDDQCASADKVTSSTVHLHLVVRETRDTSSVLKVAGEPVEDNALDLVLDFGRYFLDSVVDDGGSLAVD